MNWKQITAGTALCLLPFHAAGQEKSTTTTIETTFTKAEENHTVRLSGTYEGLFSISGFIDCFGPKTDRYYGELYFRKNFANHIGAHFEMNQGSQTGPNIPLTVRSGMIFDLLDRKNFYTNLKVLPVTITKSGTEEAYQVGIFMQANLPAGFYFESWIDYNFGKEKPATFTEFTVGKKIKGKFSAECQVPYNTNSHGWIARCGGRYNIF